MPRALPPRIVPLVNVRKGALVRPAGPRTWTTWAPTGSDAVAAAQKLYAAQGGLYVWDVDGNEYGEANLDFYQLLERARVFPWVDAGCRKAEDVMDVFLAGVEAVTIQLRHMETDRIRDVAEIAEADLHFGLTVEGSELEKRLRPRDVIDFAREIQATGVVLYEGDRAEYRRAEDIAHEIQRNGFPVTWVPRIPSPSLPQAQKSDRFNQVAVPEAPT